jgi:CheY-like chemotaxis protein
MSRILLADDSPHAQRMGEFILREDGFEVVSVTDGNTALVRLPDVDPDLILADVSLPERNGYELCQEIKNDPNRRHAKVILTAGALEVIDEGEAARVRSDAILRKPFEASAMIALAKRLVEEALQARMSPLPAELPAEPEPENPQPEPVAAVPSDSAPSAPAELLAEPEPENPQPEPVAAVPDDSAPPAPAAPPRTAIDLESVRATVTLALDAALPVLIDEISQRVLLALQEDAEGSGQ